MRSLDFRPTAHGFIRSSTSFIERYTKEDHTEVILYTDSKDVFPSYYPRRSLESARAKRNTQVSFIATAFNELSTAEMLVRSIFNQTRLPDEIIITDTGSSDGTFELLEQLAADSPVPIKILAKQGANIAQGRNLAISQAQYPIIAVTDFGCTIPDDWLENLIAPYEDNPEVQISFGRYQAIDSNKQPAKWILGWSIDNIDPQNHLPSAVSISFLKHAWEKVGGYPEWLSMTGEDTCFAFELKRSTTLWAFVPEAVVQWIAPESFSGALRKSFRWSTGDGEAGTNAQSYRWVLIKLSVLLGEILLFIALIALMALVEFPLVRIIGGVVLAAGLIYTFVKFKKRQSIIKDELWLAAVYTAEVVGFLHGLSRRPQVDQKRMAGVRGAIFIMAGVPIDDTGGGARWTQITLELLRRQYLVFFINKFPKYESKELFLEFRHPNLITRTVSNFSLSSLMDKYRPALIDKKVIGLVELPLGEFVPIIKQLHALNGVVIYDLLDAWDTSLGGQWYDLETEKQIVNSSDLLFATVPGLKQNLASQTDKFVHLVPNAVNSYLFNPQHSYSLPDDFPEAEWNIIYIGALWGEWFDWDLLAQISLNYPEAGVIVIGDAMGREFDLPENVHFLGLKSQRDLPAYLHYAQVAIVPWKVNPITQMTSPLKVYEYIAMYKPVVAPMIDPLKNIPGVFQTENGSEFIQMVGKLRDFHTPKTEMTQFINMNNWRARVDQILELSNQVRNVAEDQE
jgi:glycosyltransferase involved in cell wall biosynthesis